MQGTDIKNNYLAVFAFYYFRVTEKTEDSIIINIAKTWRYNSFRVTVDVIKIYLLRIMGNIC